MLGGASVSSNGSLGEVFQLFANKVTVEAQLTV